MERNNPVLSDSEGNELVATWENLCQRPRRTLGFMLPFSYKRFDGQVPEPGPLDDEDRALLAKVEAGFETVGALYNACKFRAAPSALLRAGLGEALAPPKALATYGPQAWQLRSNCQADAARQPWFQIKKDPQAAATSVYVTQSVRVVDNLKTLLAPRSACRTRRSSSTNTWATRGSPSAPLGTGSSARSTSLSTRKRPATVGCAATMP